MKITLQQLESLLNEQKRIVIDRLVGASYYYNTQSNESNSIPLSIDKDKFKEYGMRAPFPEDVQTLKRYED